MSFDQHPFPVPVNPAVSHPVRVRMRRTLPVAVNPNIVIAFPAMVTVNPDKSRLRRHAALFNNRSRGAYANCNLRLRSRRNHCQSQSEGEQYRQCNFLHDDSNPPGS